MTVDILFLAYNRLEFTREALLHLVQNTDWDLVDRIVIYDDGSTDGTLELTREFDAPTEVNWRNTSFGSPVAVMRDYIRDDPDAGKWFVKIDSDVAVPPGWLDELLAVQEREPQYDLIGMEAGMTKVAGRDEPWDGVYRVEPCTHIGGIGLMRRQWFLDAPQLNAHGRFGFSEHQARYGPARGWITPDLPIVLLDRLPFEPWLSLSAEYCARRWQRDWPKWDPVWMAWAWEWMLDGEEAVA